MTTIELYRFRSVEQLLGNEFAELERQSIFFTAPEGLNDYSAKELSSDILMAAHHGSLDFFDDPGSNRYFVKHMEAIEPDMTIVSVEPNSYDHPDETALRLYRQYSSGSNKGNKVYRTDQQHTMKLTLKSAGGWNITTNQ